jgi:hypothetical protein
MGATRREQPVLQEALRWAAETRAATFAKLPRTYNCRGAASCGLVKNKAGERVHCLLIHGHDAGAAATFDRRAALEGKARAAALLDAYKRPCPALGGGHPLVVVAEAGEFGGGAPSLDAALLKRLEVLSKDNDASPCRVEPRASPSWVDKSLKKCALSKTRYASIAVVGKLPQPPVHVAGAPVLIAWIRDPADAAKTRAGKESEIPNFKGSYLGRFPLVSADFWTSDHLSERSRSMDVFPGTRARRTLMLKRT